MANFIGVFDAGIGSYSIADSIIKCYTKQNVIYLADRASFPYGNKSKIELINSVERAIHYLHQRGCGVVILASNSPSILVFNALQAKFNFPVIGIYPPIKQALARSSSKQIGVLGVKSMIESEEICAFITTESPNIPAHIALINASPLVEKVENGSFLSDPERVQQELNLFMDKVIQQWPGIDVFTLSSTHLPWLKPFFARYSEQLLFLDPADELVANLEPYITEGEGTFSCIATESVAYPLSGLQEMLAHLGVSLKPELIMIKNIVS